MLVGSIPSVPVREHKKGSSMRRKALKEIRPPRRKALKEIRPPARPTKGLCYHSLSLCAFPCLFMLPDRQQNSIDTLDTLDKQMK